MSEGQDDKQGYMEPATLAVPSKKSRSDREGYESAGRGAYTLTVSHEAPERAYMKPNKKPIVCLRGYMKGKPLEIPSATW